ncbi:650_t:CDS:2 [Dentiscutata heterogama]|uniref:650_t:CDS:1 n=1 Tax=Dentiscutata heterogama TaxID=1316150 RepID=A0ACA9K5B2_9GLOM|nr:650_t:CDS:2 [Dentiscutata heterogama]
MPLTVGEMDTNNTLHILQTKEWLTTIHISKCLSCREKTSTILIAAKRISFSKTLGRQL